MAGRNGAAPHGPIVLHVGKFIPPPQAGIEAHTDTLLRALQPHIPVGLIAARSPIDPQAHQSLPYPVWTCRSWGKLDAVTVSPGVLTQALSLIRSGHVRLLHLHLPNPWADVLALLAPRTLPIVASWHSDIVRQRRLLQLYGPIQRAALRRFDRIVVATQGHLDSSCQLLQGDSRRRHRVRVVPYGIDLSDLVPDNAEPNTVQALREWQGNAPLIATVGRHVYYKGYTQLLLAMAKLTSRARLVMVGHGPNTSALQAQAADLGIADRVLWLTSASRRDVVAVLRTCDVFTLPSIEPSEAFGLASAEAMACGKPTVVCRLRNGVDCLNVQGQTSLLVPPRDVDALAAALDRLLLDPDLRARMGEQAARWIRSQFTVHHMVHAMLDVYRECLD